MKNQLTDFQFNEKTALTGVYAKSVIAQRGEGVHQGHYKIIVNDTLEVILLPPYHKEAVRPQKEVKEFEGKRVTVTGTILSNTALSKPSLESQPQTINMPCFVTIESINLEKH